MIRAVYTDSLVQFNFLVQIKIVSPYTIPYAWNNDVHVFGRSENTSGNHKQTRLTRIIKPQIDFRVNSIDF